jgi:hypothetical protein
MRDPKKRFRDFDWELALGFAAVVLFGVLIPALRGNVAKVIGNILLISIVSWIWVFSMKTTQRVLRALRWALPLIALLVVFIAFKWVDVQAPDRFFEVAAQVIPVLVLAIGLESRIVVRRLRTGGEFFLAALLLTLLGLGELAAFQAILGPNTHWELREVAAALVGGFVGVITVGLLNPENGNSGDDGTPTGKGEDG